MQGSALVLGALLSGLLACSEPCYELSRKICGCYPEDKQEECLRKRMSLRDQDRLKKVPRKVRDAREQACSDYLSTCTCSVFASGELSACGLTPD